jgi:nicotinate-nucleotide adenylyltransferase
MVKSAVDQGQLPLIGILGGTFDPIHFGHLRMAEQLADALNLTAIRFIPAAVPPHRVQPASSAAHRSAMVKLGTQGNPRFLVDERELSRSGPSYTIDTLISLRETLGNDVALCLMLGSDAFAGLSSWHQWESLLVYCHLLVVERPGAVVLQHLSAELATFLSAHRAASPDVLATHAAGSIWVQTVHALDISATDIRNDLARGQSPRYLLPDNVLDYIQRHQLYR